MNQKAIVEHWFFEKLPGFAEAAREMRHDPASAPVLRLTPRLHGSIQ